VVNVNDEQKHITTILNWNNAVRSCNKLEREYKSKNKSNSIKASGDEITSDVCAASNVPNKAAKASLG